MEDVKRGLATLVCTRGFGRKSCSPVTAPTTLANALGTRGLTMFAKWASPFSERLWMLVPNAASACATVPSKVTKVPPLATPVTVNPSPASHAVTLAMSLLLSPNCAANWVGVSHW